MEIAKPKMGKKLRERILRGSMRHGGLARKRVRGQRSKAGESISPALPRCVFAVNWS
jgi:hypothetical protein